MVTSLRFIRSRWLLWLSGAICLSIPMIAPASEAQIVPDGSVGSVVSITNGAAMITGGTQRGGNLFHSFSEFSLSPSTVNSARFDNAVGIGNIITRVSGGSISNINGLIETAGTANLFFLNPSGIVFGNQAALRIGGSFIASTADRIRFSDGTEYGAIAATPPLLTISQPIALQYGATPGVIRVEGSGHFIYVNPDPFEIVRSLRPVGLEAGRTLALIGGKVELQGGNLTAGQIEIGAVANSIVTLTPTASGWDFTYPTNATFQNVAFSQGASADASGTSGGQIHVQGQNIDVLDGSTLLALTLGKGTGGEVKLDAAGAVTVRGEFVFAGYPYFPSSLLTEVGLGATGQGGNITVNAGQFLAAEGAKISTSTGGSGNGGVMLIAAKTISIQGGSPNFGPTLLSAGSTGGETGGNGGVIRLNADIFSITEGGGVSATTNGAGNAGSVEVQAKTVDLSGNTDLYGASGIFTSTFSGSTGRGGDVSIAASQLLLSDGAQIATTTDGAGDAGNLSIKAQSIELQGASLAAPTGIFAAVNPGATGGGGLLTIETQQLRLFNGAQIAADTLGSGNARSLSITAQNIELAGVAPQGRSGIFAGAIAGTGAGGDIFLNSDRLTIRDGATISASNFSSRDQSPPGTGAAGNINLQARTISLNNGSINASTATGGRGNISLRSQTLTLLNQSLISTNSQGTEPGGNIALNTDFLVGYRNSDITANAINARGGRVTVDAQSIFGIAPRDRLTSESDITASSELGIEFNGVVQINTLDTDPARGLIKLPNDIRDNTQGIAATCGQARGNQFVVTGRGALPEDANQPFRGGAVWQDLRTPNLRTPNLRTPNLRTPTVGRVDRSIPLTQTSVIPEAQGWIVRLDGQVELVAGISTASANRSQAMNCAAQHWVERN